MKSLRWIFEEVRERAKARMPNLAFWSLRHCSDCDKEHAESPRQFAHVGHVPRVVCHAVGTEALSDEHKYGLLAHEFGHAFMIEAGLDHSEADANRIGGLILGRKIVYDGPLHLERTKP